MAYDLGDSVPLAVDIKDAAGAATNASAITLTITLPDGTTSTPSVTNPPSVTGQYRVTYVPTQEGRHVARWVTTTPSTAYVDVFDVRAAASPALLSLADVKAHLNITSTNSDDELRDYIEAATVVVEEHVGPIVRRTKTARMCGGVRWWALPDTQVLSITSVTRVRDGSTAAITISDLAINTATGVVSYKNGAWLPDWDYDVVYVVGRTVVERNWSLAARIIVQHNWESQLGNLPSIQGNDVGDVSTGSGFLLPPRALTLLEPDDVPIGFA